MYQNFYGLRELPFELTANPRYLYLAPLHREALSNLQYGMAAAKAITVLTGEAGTGKTTLLAAALASDRCRHVRCVYLNNPALTREEFIEKLARTLGLSAEASRSKTILLEELESALRANRSRGGITALVVDEAQSLSVGLLEEIRLLANIETVNEKLLPLVLVGQPDLGIHLEDRGLRQLKQRVALRCEIAAFDLAETAAYIATRIKMAGGSATRLFTREAVILIHEYSGGIPRTISVICDNALVHGLALGRQTVGQDLIREVCRDFRLSGTTADRPASTALHGADGSPPARADNLSPEAHSRAESEQEGHATGLRIFGRFGTGRH
jgi:general secretion pathway protein A